jgi:hypothetical protein
MATISSHYRDELHAAADRDRLARLAASHGSVARRPPPAGLVMVGMVLAVLALVFVTAAAIAEAPRHPGPLSAADAAGRVVSHVLAEPFLDPSAAHQIGTGRR